MDTLCKKEEILESKVRGIESKLDQILTNINVALKKNVKNLLHENLAWRKYAISCLMKAASLSHKLEASIAEVSRLQGFFPPNGALVAPTQEQNIDTFVDTNVLKRTQTHEEKYR